MTDAEFEKLDAERRRILKRGGRIPRTLLARLARCRDCERENPESYMVSRELWLQAVPTGRGCLCLACLARRLGRPLVAEDFGDPPIDRVTGEMVRIEK